MTSESSSSPVVDVGAVEVRAGAGRGEDSADDQRVDAVVGEAARYGLREGRDVFGRKVIAEADVGLVPDLERLQRAPVPDDRAPAFSGGEQVDRVEVPARVRVAEAGRGFAVPRRCGVKGVERLDTLFLRDPAVEPEAAAEIEFAALLFDTRPVEPVAGSSRCRSSSESA